MLFQVEGKDPKTGATYYYNQSTGESQWEVPDFEALISSPSRLELPSVWEEAIDPTSGFYVESILQFSFCTVCLVQMQKESNLQIRFYKSTGLCKNNLSNADIVEFFVRCAL